MSVTGPLTVAIDVQVLPGKVGGIAQFVSALVSSLGQLDDGPETYVLLVSSQAQLDWLKPVSGPNQRFVIKTPMPKRGETRFAANTNGRVTLGGLLKWSLGPLRPAFRYVQEFLTLPVPPSNWPDVRVSDGFYESLGCDVIHFPTQGFILCALPTIYNPHDLQLLHFPQFFSPQDIAARETVYSAGCHYARTVVVGSQWAREDVANHYGLRPEKIQVIAEGAPTQLYIEPSSDVLARVKSQYHLNKPFALYPAVTWPHKNHLRLLEAFAYLRDVRGLDLQLVCPGSRYEGFWPRIEKQIDDLNLSSQVSFVGFVPEEDLQALYKLSQFLVEPSLFEASSLPIFEAWSEGTPVACSDRTALPEQVLDAALLFEPGSVESVATAMEKLATDSGLRQKLRESGFRRLKDFDWTRTARAYRAVYRRAADCPLTEEDHWLLGWDWMREPQKKMETYL